jgi:hypothetical protein
MDLVTEEGEVFIATAADISFRSRNLHYAGVLQHRAGKTRAASSLRKALPVLDDRRLTWSSRALGARGTWNLLGSGAKETMISNDVGSVEWNCVMPLARAEVELEGGRVLRGFGYVEELQMTLAPWDMPIELIRLGRFTGDGASIVWIDWRGPTARSLILKHGTLVLGSVGDHTIEMPDDEASLVLDTESVIRDGTLAAGPLACMAELHGLLPTKLLMTTERKTCAPATLDQPFLPPVRGWVIKSEFVMGKSRTLI